VGFVDEIFFKMKDLSKSSKFLSLVLRHRPELIGLKLDESGWASTTDLIEKLNENSYSCDLDMLKSIVETNNKQRYAFSPDYQKIRANQGHSLDIDLKLAAQAPPEILFHGTAVQHLPSIKLQGLLRGRRHHVHLSADLQTALNVGGRHGKPVVLEVLAGEMQRCGFSFFKSENGVWLTEAVPANFLYFPL
jgi:putative RNA 2'-phosphotransferase